jgi:Mlc titration factor MtfA (ptsG expression regulator)
MFRKLRNWRVRRIVAKHPIPEPLWRATLARCAPARRLGASDQAALRVLATLFLREKSIEPVQGLELDDADRVLLATHACVPILKLGMDWFDGWHSVIVYPEAFVPRRTRVDEAGVVHESSDAMAGEAWGRGPVILSWADAQAAAQAAGRNVVIHEMAHKLDMLNGAADGFPPLHRRMNRRARSRAFAGAWVRLQEEHRNGIPLPLDAYASTARASSSRWPASSSSRRRPRCASTPPPSPSRGISSRRKNRWRPSVMGRRFWPPQTCCRACR